MYKTTVFIVVFLALSIVAVGANLIWKSDFKPSEHRIDLVSDIVPESLPETSWDVYNGAPKGRQTNAGADVKTHRRAAYGTQPEHNVVEYESHPDLDSNPDMVQWFDVPEGYTDPFLYHPRPGGPRYLRGPVSRGGGPGVVDLGVVDLGVVDLEVVDLEVVDLAKVFLLTAKHHLIGFTNHLLMMMDTHMTQMMTLPLSILYPSRRRCSFLAQA